MGTGLLSCSQVAAGKKVLPGYIGGLATAVHARAGWIGDTTTHDAAAAIVTPSSAKHIHPTDLATLQGLVEDLADSGDFYNEASCADGAGDGTFDAWTFATLATHLHDSHGGDDETNCTAAGAWARTPATGKAVHHSIIKGMALALQHLSYLKFSLDTAGYCAIKYGTAADKTSAWSNMIDSTPADYGIAPLAGASLLDLGAEYGATSWRHTIKWAAGFTPIANHYPSGWGLGYTSYKISDVFTGYLGPHSLFSGLSAETDWPAYDHAHDGDTNTTITLDATGTRKQVAMTAGVTGTAAGITVPPWWQIAYHDDSAYGGEPAEGYYLFVPSSDDFDPAPTLDYLDYFGEQVVKASDTGDTG